MQLAKTAVRPHTLHGPFVVQAQLTPHKIAVQTEDEHWTFQQLDEQSNRLAHYLQSVGVSRDSRVAVCLQRSPRMLVGLLGILKAGGAYVPLDPAFPKPRLAYMCADSRPVVLLTERAVVSALPTEVRQSTRVVYLDELDDELRRSGTAPDMDVPGNCLAYVIYTSGSTGQPKGVMIEHDAIANFLNSMAVVPGLEPHDILLGVTTLSFDICALELFLPLWVGAKLVLADRRAAADATLLSELLSRCQATVMQATPATWHMLTKTHQDIPAGLKVLVGGESLDAELARQLLKTDAELWNLYGPTETTVWSTISRIEEGFEQISIGRPIDNTQVYVLDQRLEPCPVGVVGELYIAGDGLARGYLNRADLTAERFLPNPFASVAGHRMYRTGDLAVARRWFAGLSRCADHQVKVRGFRIELGEVEAALHEIDDIDRAVAVAQTPPGGTAVLVAYVMAKPGKSIDGSELRGRLRHRLPDYMIPSYFVAVDQFPLTPNGKVDRARLPEVPTDRQAIARANYICAAPRSPNAYWRRSGPRSSTSTASVFKTTFSRSAGTPFSPRRSPHACATNWV